MCDSSSKTISLLVTARQRLWRRAWIHNLQVEQRSPVICRCGQFIFLPADTKQPVLPRTQRSACPYLSLRDIFQRQFRKADLQHGKGCVPRESFFATALVDLTLQLRQPLNGTEESSPTELLAVPVQTKISDNYLEPSGEGGWSLRSEQEQATKVVAAQLLACKKETISGDIGVTRRTLRYLEYGRTVYVQKLRPRIL